MARPRASEVSTALRARPTSAGTRAESCRPRGREWTALEAFAIQSRGKVYFDTGDFENALADMTAAVFLREKLGASPAEIQAALTAVAVVQSALDAQRGSARSERGEGGTDHA